PVGRVDHADAEPDFLRDCGKVGNERQAMQELASRNDRQTVRKLLHEAERFAQLLAIGCFRNHDPVQRPNRIELQLLGNMSEVDDLAYSYLVPEVWQIQSEFHAEPASFFTFLSKERATRSQINVTVAIRPCEIDLLCQSWIVDQEDCLFPHTS